MEWLGPGLSYFVLNYSVDHNLLSLFSLFFLHFYISNGSKPVSLASYWFTKRKRNIKNKLKPLQFFIFYFLFSFLDSWFLIADTELVDQMGKERHKIKRQHTCSFRLFLFFFFFFFCVETLNGSLEGHIALYMQLVVINKYFFLFFFFLPNKILFNKSTRPKPIREKKQNYSEDRGVGEFWQSEGKGKGKGKGGEGRARSAEWRTKKKK